MASATTAAIEVLASAFEKARQLRSKVVGQEHVLLALADRPDTLGAMLLDKVGVASGLSALPMWITPGSTEEPDPEPTVRLVKAVDGADAEARAHDRATTSADLVLGILRADIGVGYQLLRSAGVSLDGARAALASVLEDPHAELDGITELTLRSVLG